RGRVFVVDCRNRRLVEQVEDIPVGLEPEQARELAAIRNVQIELREPRNATTAAARQDVRLAPAVDGVPTEHFDRLPRIGVETDAEHEGVTVEGQEVR